MGTYSATVRGALPHREEELLEAAAHYYQTRRAFPKGWSQKTPRSNAVKLYQSALQNSGWGTKAKTPNIA